MMVYQKSTKGWVWHGIYLRQLCTQAFHTEGSMVDGGPDEAALQVASMVEQGNKITSIGKLVAPTVATTATTS